MDINNPYLRAHASEYVWLAPYQDRHFNLRPARITSNAGAIKRMRVAYDQVQMPDTYSRWHVYQIGGIDPLFFNLFYKLQEWTSLMTVATEKKMVVSIHNPDGIEVPRFDSYYCYTQQGALLLAVRINRLIPIDFATDEITLRVFSNRWWETPSGLANSTGYQVQGRRIESSGDTTAFTSQYNAAAALTQEPFQLQYYHNGVRRKTYVAAAVAVGDTVEYVLDGSIYRYEEKLVSGLMSFESTLDAKQKSLLHFPKANIELPGIYTNARNHDFYIEGTVANPPSYILHRASVDTIRPLTHNDFSLNTTAIHRTSMALLNNGGGNQTFNHKVVVFMRRTASEKSLLSEHHYIRELYKLPDADIVSAMVGSQSTVDVWKAANLEASGYAAVSYSNRQCDIAVQDIERGYGYYAMAKVLADSPVEVINPGATGFVNVSYMLAAGGCTMYEYDEDGLLLGWHHHYVGGTYFVKNNLCRTVEMIAGLGGQALDEIHGVQSTTLRTDCNYKVYERTQISDTLQPGFIDVTGTSKYTITDNTFNWVSTDVTSYPSLRSDRKFFAADYELVPSDGQLRITLLTLQNHAGNTSALQMVIPLGQMDVMLNGRSLIRGMEYFYRDGVVFITAKRYMNFAANATQKVHVRFYGFCDASGKLRPEGDVGFIQHGVLSRNNRFDVRDGRVVRIIAGGQLKRRNQLEVSEDSVTVDPSNDANGYPYMIRDAWVPLKPYVAADTWGMIETAYSKSKEISDYLTVRIPEVDRGDIVTITQRHQLISPFLCTILYDLLYSRLSIPSKLEFTRQDIATICKSYEPFLDVDPIGADLDERYVIIHPHGQPNPMGVNVNIYRFFQAVINYYAPGKVDLTNALVISN